MITTHAADTAAHTNRALSGDLAGTLGVPTVAKMRGVALANPFVITDKQVPKYDAVSNTINGGNVDWSELSGRPTTFTPAAHTHTESDIDSGTSTDGQVLTSDGAGGAAWETPTGGSGGGDVTGPSSATDGHLAVFDGTSGKIIKDGGAVGSGGGDSVASKIFMATNYR